MLPQVLRGIAGQLHCLLRVGEIDDFHRTVGVAAGDGDSSGENAGAV